MSNETLMSTRPDAARSTGGGGAPMADLAMADEQAAAPPSAPEPRSAPARRTSTLAQLRRDENGLTTLEWLLIVAAVAGLAALAVVLVSNVVGQTSEQIAGNSARLTAARLAADEIERRLIADMAAVPTADWPSGGSAQAEVDALAADALRACRRLAITYSDLPNIMTGWDWNGATTGLGAASTTQSDWIATYQDGADEGCVVTATT